MGFDEFDRFDFTSYYPASSNNDNFRFIVNGSSLVFKIGNEIQTNRTIRCHDLIPSNNGIRALGTSGLRWDTSYINDIVTTNHSSIDTSITNLETKTAPITISGNEMIIDKETIKHEYNGSVYLVLNGDKDNNNASQGSYLTLYAHSVFNGYLGTIGDFIDLHSFSAGTVKPIKFTFQDSGGTHTSLSCDDENISFNVNVIPETDSTYSLGNSSKAFSTSYIDDITTTNHTSIDTAITNLQGSINIINSNVSSNTLAINTNSSNIVSLLLKTAPITTLTNDISFSLNIIPDTDSTYSLGNSSKAFTTSYIDNIITSSHNVNSAINSLNTKTQNISATSTTTTIGGTGKFTNIQGQFDLPNNTNVDGLLTFLGTSVVDLNSDTTAISYDTSPTAQQSTYSGGAQTDINSDLFVKGNNIWLRGSGDSITHRMRLHNNDANSYIDFTGNLNIRRGTATKIEVRDTYIATTGQIRAQYNTQDTSIQWGLIDDIRPNVNGFISSIFFDTSKRDCFIGVVTESADSTAGVGIGVSGGGSPDPDMAVYFASTGSAYFRGSIYAGGLKPAIDNTYDVGESSLRYDDIYATNGSINTSDEREKNSIETLDETEMKDFISLLNPVKYKFNNKTRYHCGLISQEVKEHMPFDFGLYIYNEEADTYGLRYTELIAPMISTIQNLIKENNNLKKDNENIKNRLNTIEELLGIS